MLGQRENIFGAVAKRRQVESHHAEPVIQILAEPLVANRLGQVRIRGGNHADVNRNRLRSPHARNYFLFEHSQQLCLPAQAHIADFIQKQRAPFGQLKFPLPHVLSVGECSFFMAEQLAFQ